MPGDEQLPKDATELATTILAFARSLSPNSDLIARALFIAHEANSADRFAGHVQEAR
jgi:hypothetical protein